MFELVGGNEVPRLVEGSHNKTLCALNEVKGAGIEPGHLAVSQSEDSLTVCQSHMSHQCLYSVPAVNCHVVLIGGGRGE